MFSDILIPVEAMGQEVRLTEQKGPELPDPIAPAGRSIHSLFPTR
jgi:uroporphyrinogen decarboxylase